ncbi:MAG: amylo-alpha-1,6-glucosidase [Bilophila wadsworthia]
MPAYAVRLADAGTERASYRPLYEGGPAERDEAYHQGTVWPWLLGAYGEAVLRAAWDVPGSVRGAAADHTALVRPAPRRRGDRVRFGNF